MTQQIVVTLSGPLWAYLIGTLGLTGLLIGYISLIWKSLK